MSGSGPAPTSVTEDRVRAAYEDHAVELRRFANARLHDSEAAQDLVHEAFIRLTAESREGRHPTQTRAWLYRVVHNLIVSGARHAAVERRVGAQERFDDVVRESPETRYLDRERSHAVATALEAAGADGRTGLILAAQGFSGQEIATALGRTDGATRTLMYRARRTVHRELVGVDVGQSDHG